MKKLIILSVFIFIGVASQGQLNFGISGGLNLSSIPDRDEITINDHTIETLDDNYTGFHIGFMSQISLPFIFVQPELLYTSIGNDMRRTSELTEEEVYYERKIRRIDLPVLAGTYIGPVRVGLGPVGSILVGESSVLDDDIDVDEFEEDINRMTFGYQLGAGINISNLVLDVKYEGGLTKLGDRVIVGGEKQQFDSRPRQFIISLGVLL